MEEEILARAKEQSHLMETVRAATIIKLMSREVERESAWRNLYAEVTNAGISVGKYQIGFGFIQTLLSGLVNVIIIYLGARLILTGQGFSVGMLFAFLSFRQTFNERAVGLINQLVQFRLLGLHLDRLSDIVTAVPEAENAPVQPRRQGSNHGSRAVVPLWRRRPVRAGGCRLRGAAAARPVPPGRQAAARPRS